MSEQEQRRHPDLAGLDADWYRARYPDIGDTDPAAHFALVGWTQFRDPAPWFSTAAYLKAYPDVAAAAVDPLQHWLRFGRVENRAIFAADTPLDQVRAAAPPSTDLMGLAETVDRTAMTAAAIGHADDLHELTRFLAGQLDIAVQATARLATDDADRAARLARALEGWDVSALLRAVAADTVARHPALHLPEQPAPDVSIIVPAFGRFGITYACLESILAHPGRATMEVVLVDDGSTDETVFASFVLQGGIRILRLGRNAGFVGAINAGAAVARGRLLLMLNNDTCVQPGWLDAMVDTLDADPRIGVVGARLLDAAGRVQECGGVVWRDGRACNLGRGADPARPDLCCLREVDYVSGAALLIPRDLFDALGGLDPAYAPGYYEDTDLCFRVRAAGRRVVVQPAADVVHAEGATAGRAGCGGGMKRFQDRNHGLFKTRWAPVLAAHAQPGDEAAALARYQRRVALFVDETTPTPDRDAGSNAALSHMRSLQRLGYAVRFVPSHNMMHLGDDTRALERIGVLCHRAPWTTSVEDVLRQHQGPLDLVYLHRLHSAVQYTGLVRRHAPHARVVFNVADLHHLRTEREAAVTGDAALKRHAAALRLQEIAAVQAADAVLVHSAAEAAVLAREAPGTTCVTVPWTIEPRPVATPFADRAGIAFVGGFRHHPNPDAACWLAHEIMPLVWREAPEIELVLIGPDMPECVRALARPGVRVLGHVPDLDAVLATVRLTVAPLRFGAGLKGKVLTSFAAGLPCVMSATAAEGMDLPRRLAALVCTTAAEHAATILAIHGDPERAAAVAADGLDWVARTCAPARVDRLLKSAIHPAPPRPSPRPEPAPVRTRRPVSRPASRATPAGAPGW